MSMLTSWSRILWILILGAIAWIFLFKAEKVPDAKVTGGAGTSTAVGSRPTALSGSPAVRMMESQEATKHSPIVRPSVAEKVATTYKRKSLVAVTGSEPTAEDPPEQTGTIPSQETHRAERPDLKNSHPEIGRPFPLSDSLSVACKHRRWCTNLAVPLLAEFAKEPRDQKWASQNEAALGAYVQARGPSEFKLRVVECRTTLCVMEVASPAGRSFRDGRKLYEVDGLQGIDEYEYMDSVVEDVPVYNVRVTLWIYRRRAE